MVFELRKKNGNYYVNARYGHPEPKANSEAPLEQADGWNYIFKELPLRCGLKDDTPKLQCKLEDWQAKIFDINPEPTKEQPGIISYHLHIIYHHQPTDRPHLMLSITNRML
jgi:hypothetical protein